VEREENRVHARLAGDLAGRGVGALAKELELRRKRGEDGENACIDMFTYCCVFFFVSIAIAVCSFRVASKVM